MKSRNNGRTPVVGAGPTRQGSADAEELARILQISSSRHSHICPRQVLGARVGLLGLQMLGIETPYEGKPLHVFVETDGCFVDGLSVATDCRVAARTLHVVDYGKMAATLVDAHTERAYRIHPLATARRTARDYAPDASDKWHAYLEGYQLVPDDLLLAVKQVQLRVAIKDLVSTSDARAECSICGEEIFNSREVVQDGRIVCRGCAGPSYFLQEDPDV